MEIINEVVIGNLNISKDRQYNSLSGCNVTVDENITVRIYGTIQNLYLKKGATVILHGKITGDVLNEGGTVNLYSNKN